MEALNNVHVCEDRSDCQELLQSASLYLKPIARITITVTLPKLKTGQSISNWEIMEKLRMAVKPIKFASIKVIKSTMEFLRFDAEINNKSNVEAVIKKIDLKGIRLSGFTELLKIRAGVAKVNFPTRHDWDSFFRDTKYMNEMKAGERPDTVVLKGMPVRWFSQFTDPAKNRPSDQLIQRIMSQFGEVRYIDIPTNDPLRPKMSPAISGLTPALVSSKDILFTCFVQFREYIGFAKCMHDLQGKKLVYVEDDKAWCCNIEVDFDRTKHLTDYSIKKRKEERERLMALDKEKQEKLRKQQELEAKTQQQERDRENAVLQAHQEKKELRQREKAVRREKREQLRRDRKLRKQGELMKLEGGSEQDDDALCVKIAAEERKLLMAQRRLESIRLLDELFDRIKVVRQRGDSARKREELAKKDRNEETEEARRQADQEQQVRDRLVSSLKQRQEAFIGHQKRKVTRAQLGQYRLSSIMPKETGDNFSSISSRSISNENSDGSTSSTSDSEDESERKQPPGAPPPIGTGPGPGMPPHMHMPPMGSFPPNSWPPPPHMQMMPLHPNQPPPPFPPHMGPGGPPPIPHNEPPPNYPSFYQPFPPGGPPPPIGEPGDKPSLPGPGMCPDGPPPPHFGMPPFFEGGPPPQGFFFNDRGRGRGGFRGWRGDFRGRGYWDNNRGNMNMMRGNFRGRRPFPHGGNPDQQKMLMAQKRKENFKATWFRTDAVDDESSSSSSRSRSRSRKRRSRSRGWSWSSQSRSRSRSRSRSKSRKRSRSGSRSQRRSRSKSGSRRSKSHDRRSRSGSKKSDNAEKKVQEKDSEIPTKSMIPDPDSNETGKLDESGAVPNSSEGRKSRSRSRSKSRIKSRSGSRSRSKSRRSGSKSRSKSVDKRCSRSRSRSRSHHRSRRTKSRSRSRSRRRSRNRHHSRSSSRSRHHKHKKSRDKRGSADCRESELELSSDPDDRKNRHGFGQEYEEEQFFGQPDEFWNGPSDGFYPPSGFDGNFYNNNMLPPQQMGRGGNQRGFRFNNNNNRRGWVPRQRGRPFGRWQNQGPRFRGGYNNFPPFNNGPMDSYTGGPMDGFNSGPPPQFMGPPPQGPPPPPLMPQRGTEPEPNNEENIEKYHMYQKYFNSLAEREARRKDRSRSRSRSPRPHEGSLEERRPRIDDRERSPDSDHRRREPFRDEMSQPRSREKRDSREREVRRERRDDRIRDRSDERPSMVRVPRERTPERGGRPPRDIAYHGRESLKSVHPISPGPEEFGPELPKNLRHIDDISPAKEETGKRSHIRKRVIEDDEDDVKIVGRLYSDKIAADARRRIGHGTNRGQERPDLGRPYDENRRMDVHKHRPSHSMESDSRPASKVMIVRGNTELDLSPRRRDFHDNDRNKEQDLHPRDGRVGEDFKPRGRGGKFYSRDHDDRFFDDGRPLNQQRGRGRGRNFRGRRRGENDFRMTRDEYIGRESVNRRQRRQDINSEEEERDRGQGIVEVSDRRDQNISPQKRGVVLRDKEFMRRERVVERSPVRDRSPEPERVDRRPREREPNYRNDSRGRERMERVTRDERILENKRSFKPPHHYKGRAPADEDEEVEAERRQRSYSPYARRDCKKRDRQPQRDLDAMYNEQEEMSDRSSSSGGREPERGVVLEKGRKRAREESDVASEASADEAASAGDYSDDEEVGSKRKKHHKKHSKKKKDKKSKKRKKDKK